MARDPYGPYWWEAEEGEVHSAVVQYVSAVESEQSEIFNRFVKLAALYDPNDRGSNWMSSGGPSGPTVNVTQNVIARNIDTVTALVGEHEVRPRFTTDEGDWSEQRQARRRTWYAEGLAKKLDLHRKCNRGFKGGALKGTGLVKIYTDRWNQIQAERVPVDDVVVDEGEARCGKPQQMHHRVLTSKEVLRAEYPEFESEIDNASISLERSMDSHYWAGYRPIERDQIVVIESWKLPIGVKGQEGYKPGRHTICIHGVDLLDEEWHRPYFPFARFVWEEREYGWYGIGLAERIAGHQRALIKLNWQIDRALDQIAVPTTYVRLADANLAVKSTSALGTLAVVKGDMPKTVIPPAVSGETYNRQDKIEGDAYEESGVSRLAATARKPGGLDSGAAIREYRDSTTQRFATQEKAFERFVLDAIWLAMMEAKALGANAPEVVHAGRFGRRAIKWSEVDGDVLRTELQAASNLSRTPAGRLQFVLELAQGGIISQDSARRLLLQNSSLDVEGELSLYVAALEDIEATIEEIEEGELVVPEPFQNLKLGIWRVQQAMLRDKRAGAPEEVLEALRQWIVQAVWIQGQATQPEMGAPAMPVQEAGPALQGAGVEAANLLQ